MNAICGIVFLIKLLFTYIMNMCHNISSMTNIYINNQSKYKKIIFDDMPSIGRGYVKAMHSYYSFK